MTFRKISALGVCLFCFGGIASAEIIVTLGVSGLTGNDSGDTETGEGQLTIDVGNDIGGALTNSTSQVRFRFHNQGSEPCSITDIYFDDGHLLGIAFLENDPEAPVQFSEGASPPNLPGANLAVPPFETTEGFSADSDPPTQPFGINPGESLGIVFDILPGHDRFDIVDDLANESLRIGIHVQGFASGGSESFLNVPTPEPAGLTFLLFAMPLVCRRRRA